MSQQISSSHSPTLRLSFHFYSATAKDGQTYLFVYSHVCWGDLFCDFSFQCNEGKMPLDITIDIYFL